jgi:hypothetical protein
MREKKPKSASFVLISLMRASIFAGSMGGADVSAGGAEEEK